MNQILTRFFRPAMGLIVLLLTSGTDLPAEVPNANGPFREISPEEWLKIESALPSVAPAEPKQRRKLMIFDRNVNYDGHKSIPYANLAFTLMGGRTGAFETVVETEPSAFEKENLGQYDAVFFNNTVGNLFQDPTLRQNLADFVTNGGGLMSVHGSTTAFTFWPGAKEDWPLFGEMLGARGASHRINTEEVVVKVEDADHPVVAVFKGKRFTFSDEYFRYTAPYSRERVRVLLSFDTELTDMNQGRAFGNVVREDGDYPVAWVRQYGQGRVFHCTIAHNPYVFWDRTMLRFYLAATQFVLGDLDGSTVPSIP